MVRTTEKAFFRWLRSKCDRSFGEEEVERIKASVLKAYRWQYIFSGVEHPRFQALFQSLTTEDQRERINKALSPLM